jgi:hypothetical protein
MSEKTVLDAVNTALGDAVDAPTETEELETPEPEGEETETPEPEGEPEGETEPEAEETDEEAEARGAERNPDGTFKKKDPKAEEKAPEGEKKPEAKKEPPKKDPVNDPIPENLKKETSERIRSLIDIAKTTTGERDAIKKDFDYLIQGVQATGATPAQYGETLSWLALFNSRDPAQQEKALELVESVAERLATLLGKERVVGDPLGAHQDLKDAVKTGQITAQYAKEIARTRNGQQFRTELQTGAQNEAQRQQQAQFEEQQGRQSLTDLEATLMASDPQYAQKKALLVPALKPIMAQIPWSQKKDKFLEAYRALQLPSAAARPAATAPKNQPLRPKNPAGGQAKAPSSMLEAISGALGSMGK